MTFAQKYSTIQGLSDIRRFPRLGVIRLGIKKQTAKGTEYPAEVDYFVCPPEVQEVYGKEPKELDIMFPMDDIAAVFPQAYKFYGSGFGLKCKGNGETADRANDGGVFEEVECPCDLLEQGKCKQVGVLNFIIPKVSMGGVYQITTSSFHSIVDLNSGMDYTAAMLNGRFAMVPLKLRREATETHHDGKKQTHYTMKVFLDESAENVLRLRSGGHQKLLAELPPPLEENPALAPVDIIEDEEPQPPGVKKKKHTWNDRDRKDFYVFMKDKGLESESDQRKFKEYILKRWWKGLYVEGKSGFTKENMPEIKKHLEKLFRAFVGEKPEPEPDGNYDIAEDIAKIPEKLHGTDVYGPAVESMEKFPAFFLEWRGNDIDKEGTGIPDTEKRLKLVIKWINQRADELEVN